MSRGMRHLIDDYLEGSLTGEDFDAFTEWLAADPSHRDQLLDRAELNLSLRRSLTRRAASADPTPDAALPVSPRDRAEAGASFKIAPVYLGIAAAVLLSAAAVAVYLFVVAPQTVNESPYPDAAPIATLIDSTGTVLVNDNIANPGSEYAPGEYATTSGSAQFLLNNHVTVDLRGDSRLTVHDPMRTTLARGAARFHCPPRAAGFTVSLPDGSRVVDLGTEFTLRVDDEGRTWTEVTEGAVRIDIDDWSYLVTAGEAVRIADGSIVPLPGSRRDRLAMLIREDPALVSYSPMNHIGNAPGRFEGDRALRPDGSARRLPESDPTASFTLAVWVNPDTLDGLRALMVTESDRPGRVHWQIQPDGRITLGTSRSSGPHAYRASARLTESHLKRWTHLAIVADGERKTLTFYVDGEPAGRHRIGSDDAFEFSRAVIGDSQRWPGRRLDGRLDDLIVLDRAMDEYEILNHAEAGRPLKNPKESRP